MTTHTPGPWSVMWQNSRPREYGGGITLWEVPVQVGGSGNGGNVIASVGMGGPGATVSTKESVEANACLIAASPDLFSCLVAYVEIEEQAAPASSSPLRERARAAIAKATGAKS